MQLAVNQGTEAVSTLSTQQGDVPLLRQGELYLDTFSSSEVGVLVTWPMGTGGDLTRYSFKGRPWGWGAPGHRDPHQDHQVPAPALFRKTPSKLQGGQGHSPQRDHNHPVALHYRDLQQARE